METVGADALHQPVRITHNTAQFPDKYVKQHMFIREFFVFDRNINRGDLGIDPYGTVIFVLQRIPC